MNWENSVDMCFYCPKMCHFACPVCVASGDEAYSPGRLMSMFKLANEGTFSFEKGAASFFACSGCYHCQRYCLHGNDVPGVMFLARQRAFQLGEVPPLLVHGVRRAHDGVLVERVRRAYRRWFGAASTSSSVAFFPYFEEVLEFPQVVRRAYRLLGRWLGSFPYVDLGGCIASGQLLYALGDWVGWSRHRERLRELFGGFRYLVVHSLGDVWILRKALEGLGVVVLSFWEYIARHVEREKIIMNSGLCREGGVYFPPLQCRVLGEWGAKELLTSLFPSLPLPFQGEDSRCVGVGFGLEYSYPELSEEMGEEFLRLLGEFQVQVVWVPCAQARWHLRRLVERGDFPVVVRAPEEGILMRC